MIMNDFRKQMHIVYKQKMAEIIDRFLRDAIEDGDKVFEPSIWAYIVAWVDKNCLPMGDFDKEKAMKEIEEWSE